MLKIYKASAGSGKTHTLTREYLLMLFREYQQHHDHIMPHSRILAVTFTKKATAEMKERILKSLYKLSKRPTKSPFYDDITKALHINEITLQEQARELLIGILKDYSRFSVSTIDGFFQQVIRTFAMDLGLSTTYDLALDGKEVVQQAVDDLFRRIRKAQQSDADILSWITEFTQQNIDDNRKWNPYKDISGFATELLKEQLIRHMSNVQAFFADKKRLSAYYATLKQIVNNTEGAIKQVQQKAQELMANVEGLKKAAISAFFKPIDTLTKEGLKSTFLSVVENPENIYVKKNTTRAQQEYILDLYNRELEPLYKQLIDIIEKQIVDYNTANAILKNLYTVGLLQDIAAQIEETNRQIGRIPMHDTNMLLHEVIDGQDAPFIYERTGQHIHHFMIDEFQDTSALQWENFRPLIDESEGNNNDNLIVGDVKQSIYRWRNSDWQLLEGVHKQFDNCEMPPMHTNWRSAELLINQTKQLMLKYSDWVYEAIKEEEQNTPIAAAVKQIYDEGNIDQKAAYDLPGVFHLEFYDGENEEVIEQTLENIVLLINKLKDKEGFTLNQIALLVRYGKDAELLANHLVANNIAVQSAEGMCVKSHPAVQLLIALMSWHEQPQNEIFKATIKELYPSMTEEQDGKIQEARKLPLYEQVQQYIHILHLNEQENALPYLTAFQDQIYQFTQKRVADVGAFLEYWKIQKDKATIPSSPTVDAIRILTIHSSKGLEFDVVILPFLNWDLQRMKNHMLWCRPNHAPFNQLPLVAISASKNILQTHFRNDYVQELISQYIDNLNLTYVAFTRPKYRLYAYGQMYNKKKDKTVSILNIGHLLSHLYDDRESKKENALFVQNEKGAYIYHQADKDLTIEPDDKNKDEDEEDKVVVQIHKASYVHSPIGTRIKLRSRTGEDFKEDTPLETVDLGLLMHEYLSYVITWEDALPALKRMRTEGRITGSQQTIMEQQLQALQSLLQREGKEHWFNSPGLVLTEQDILTTTGQVQRPDRIMINGQTATVVDYKFGEEKTKKYQKQLSGYILELKNMGYQVDAYIVYVALQKIVKI